METRCIHCNQRIVPDDRDGVMIHLTASGPRCAYMDTYATPPYSPVTDTYWTTPPDLVPDMGLVDDIGDAARILNALAQCNVCGAVVSDRKIHADWHGRRP